MNTCNKRRRQPESPDPIDGGDRFDAPPALLPLGEAPIVRLRPSPTVYLPGLVLPTGASPHLSPPMPGRRFAPTRDPAATPTGTSRKRRPLAPPIAEAPFLMDSPSSGVFATC